MVGSKDAAFIITPGFYKHYTSLEKVGFFKSLIHLQNKVVTNMSGNEQTDNKEVFFPGPTSEGRERE